MRRLPVVALAGAVVALAAALPAPGAGQANAAGDAAGWIGLQVDVRTTASAAGLETRVVVTSVAPGGPAERAGLRPGDVLVRMGEVDARDFARPGGAPVLRAGEPVRIVFQREGAAHQVDVVPEARVASVAPPQRVTLLFEADSMVATVSRAIDSLRTVLRARAGPGRTPVRLLLPDSAGPEVDSIRALLVELDVRMPYELGLFVEGERFRSLRGELDALRREMELVRRELVTTRSNVAPQDRARLRVRLSELARASEALRRQISEASRRAAASHPEVVAAGSDDAPAPTPRRFSPLAPYLLGQNRVAGAEVVDLEPELAAYFGVTAGVLVVSVPPGTPADAAGLRPGDVVTHADTFDVASVEDLRLALSRTEPPVRLTVIRERQPVEILLRQ